MATRMQQRRGTAAQWTSANPILAAGEIGFESDTNKFKLGNGSSHWADLQYFVDASVAIDSTEMANQINAAISDLIGGAPENLDTFFEFANAINQQSNAISNIVSELSNIGNSISTLDDNVTTLQNDLSNTQSDLSNLSNVSSSHIEATSNIHGIVNALALIYNDNSALTDERTPINGSVSTDKLASASVTAEKIAIDAITNEKIANNAVDTNEIKNSAVTNDKLAGSIAQSKITNLESDLNSKQDKVSGVSDTEIGYLDGLTSNVQSQLDGKQEIVSGVSSTEIGYLDGVTSAIQTQLNSKLNSSTASSTYAPLANPTLTGTPTAPTASANTNTTQIATTEFVKTAVNNLIDSAPGALDTLNELAAAIGNDSSYASTITTALAAKAPLASPTFTGTVSGITKDMVGLSKVDNTYDIDKPISTATQSALDAKAPLASPTFTGTVTLPTGTVTSGMILDGTIVNADISSSAAIDKTKISGTAVTQGDTSTVTNTMLAGSIAPSKITGTAVTQSDTGTVTSTMIADNTIVNGDISSSAAIALSKLATDPLARANHTGTQTASTISDFDTQVRTSKVTDLAAPTGSFSMNSQKITNLATPTNDNDAANKQYVDAAVNNINIHESVVAATTGNVNLTNAVDNNKVLDGVTLSTGNRILVKNQSTASQNGIYIVAANGAPTRATDYDAAGEVSAGDFIFVKGGTVNANTGWVQTADVTTVGTDSISFTQFSGAGTYSANNGLTLTGTTFSINTAITADLTTAQTLTNKTLTSPTITGTGAIAGTFTGNITGNVTGNVSGNAGTVTDGVYTTDTGTVTNTMLAGSIAPSKITGTAITAADTGTVTSTMIANGTIVDADINASAAIAQSKISGLSSSLAAKADLASPTFTGTVSGITKSMVGLGNVDNTSDANKPVSTAAQTALDLKANLASPTLTGTPAAPTATAGTNTTQIATTAFVTKAVSDVINGAPGALDTLNELAAALGNDASYATTITNALALKAPLASPTLTGTPAAPTATADTNTTQLATTAYVVGQAGSATPVMNGTAAVGTSLKYARQDHVHATDTSRAPLASPTFTGTVTVSSSGVAFTDGTQTKEGVPSRTPIVQKTASYTLSALTERDSMIEVSSTSATTVTIPSDTAVNYPVGTTLDILQTNTGQVTIAGDTGVTVNATPGLKLRTQWSSATLMKRAANTWVVFGDLSA